MAAMDSSQNTCKRCGTCCENGGPALHLEDKQLVVEGSLPRAHLITIRKGELVHNPVTNRLQSVRQELIKISGVGNQWNCFYFDPKEKGCTIYETRPKACRILECWNTAPVEEIIAKDTLSRLDLIADSDPLYQAVQEHESSFPCPDIKKLLQSGPQGNSANLEERANLEVEFRTSLVNKHDLSLGEELFHFGRPLFHLFISVGAKVVEVDRRLQISWPDK